MGELIHMTVDLPPVEFPDSKNDGQPSAGLSWTLSEKTQETVREIEASMRAAEQMSGSLLIG
ncbi:hypothetical protein [Methylobacterium sp. J-092]|uniref:hypothetical protein n=1 Tax=Methylobacterium sp. J-092 TaxID=2836667 RepID=UPI001FBB00FA|nr:hypothetical protein [Methylobacterium sp. J-092]MCJ2008209.1 hypothetical protein [Methylobacterium sp. J-092]